MKVVTTILACVVLFIGAATGAERGATGYPTAGLDERPGAVIPPDLTFLGEDGRPVALRDLTDVAAVLTLVYFGCRDVCPQLLAGLAATLDEVALVPGKDFRIITLSFDDADTPEVAARHRPNYLRAMRRPPPDTAWRFLTGDAGNVRKVADAVGFRYARTADGFAHPEVLIVLAPGGIVTKYLHFSGYRYGSRQPLTVSPAEIASALSEASKGRVSRAGARSPLFCSLDARGGRELLRVLRFAGGLTLVAALGLFVWLGARRKRKSG